MSEETGAAAAATSTTPSTDATGADTTAQATTTDAAPEPIETTEAEAPALVAMRSHVVHPSGVAGALAGIRRDANGKIIAVRLQNDRHHLSDWLPAE
jgi:hypothetical protein